MSRWSRRLALLVLGVLFTFPAVHLLFFVQNLSLEWSPFLASALKGSVVQALCSTFATLILGGFGAWGLLGVRRRFPSWLSVVYALVLLPGFLPPLLVLTLGFRVLPWVPYGLWGVVIFHCLMNMGLASIAIEKIMFSKVMPWMDLARVEGVSSWRFWLRGGLPNLKNEGLALFFFFFFLFISSFSIPFLIGGAFYGGVEVFLYELIFLYRDWGQALGLSLFLVFIFLWPAFLSPQTEAVNTPPPKSQPITVGRLRLALIPLLPPLFLFCGLAKSVSGGWSNTLESMQVSLFQGSLLVGLGCGLCFFLLSSILIYGFVTPKVSRLLFYWLPPGWMVVSFSMFLLSGDSTGALLLKTIYTLTLLFFPVLFRLGLYQDLEALRPQVDVGRTMVTDWDRIFFRILWPQILPRLAFLSGIAATWAAGDFAVSSVLLKGSPTVALEMKDLLMNYQLAAAEALVVPLAFVLIVVFLTFQGLGYVCRRQSL